MAKKPKSITSSMQLWAIKLDIHSAALMRRIELKAKLAQAVADEREAEAGLAMAGLATFRAGYSEPGSWLVWWYNNGDTSPRGDAPCIEDAAQIPADTNPMLKRIGEGG